MAKPTTTKTDPIPTIKPKEVLMTTTTPVAATALTHNDPIEDGVKEKTSDRLYLRLNSKGELEDCDIGECTVSRYKLDWRGVTGEYDSAIDPAGSFEQRTSHAFGWGTKLGNVVNTWKRAAVHTRVESPKVAIEEFINGVRDLKEPTFHGRKRGAGPRFNMLKLAEAFILSAKENGEKFPSAEWTDAAWVASVQLEIPDSPVLDAIRTNPKVMAKYDALIGKVQVVTGFGDVFAAAKAKAL